MPASSPIQNFTVIGHIFDQFSTPIANAKVQAFDKDLRAEQLLGEKITDNNGFYSITFSSLAAMAKESKTPDVFIKVFDNTAKSLGQSAIVFNINTDAPTIIDFKVGNTEINPINEFDALVNLLQPLVIASNLQIKDLVEKEPNHDISFLAGETGRDQTHIELLVKAFQLADAANKSFTPLATRPTIVFDTATLLPAVFYGLLRMGLPVFLNELLQINADSIRKAIKQAMNANIISTKFEKRLDEIIKIFNDLSVKKALDGDDGQPALLKQLFGSLLSAEQQKKFAATYFENENQPEKFWEELKPQPGFTDGIVIEKTKRVLILNLLTGKQPELAQHLFNKQTTDPDLKDMSGFAKYSKADWKLQITASGISSFPVWVKGETKEAKAEHYAALLEQLHKQLYPTIFFAARMKQDSQSAFSLKDQLNIFFSKNPTFELDTKNIQKQFVRSNFNGINADSIKNELKKLNRLYKLTDDYKQVNELYGKQLFSSADIVKNYGREQFVAQFASVTGGASNAAQLYKKAVSVNNKTTALITAFKMRHDIDIYAIDGGRREQEEHVEFWKGYHEMFADRELCECEHCQSVYSPAAYFVDMLQFIKDRNEAAFNELLRRRPDLEHILLTCKNTNTPLPYIDLVNELLEKEAVAVLLPEGVKKKAVRNQSFQTKGTSGELMAIPEHININVYEENLKTVSEDAVFSALLPLNLPLEEIRAYTEKLGWNRYELMDTFYSNNEPGKMKDANLAAELFGFSKAELDIINGVNPFTVTIPADPITHKQTINLLLETTKLSYINLLQLLETNFLNKPTANDIRPVQIKQIEEGAPGQEQLLTCNLEKLELTGATNEWLNKVPRFTRFMNKIGWNIFDIDRTLQALTITGIIDFPPNETEFNQQLLIPFAQIEKIKRLLNIPVRQVITFFGNIDTTVYLDHTKEGQPAVLSLYDELFRGAVVNDASIVCAAFGIAAAEYTSLQTSEDFSLPNLSRIYRYVLLSRSLKVSIIELKEVINFTGNQTKAIAWTPETLSAFLARWQVFKSTGIKAVEFKECFNAASDEEYMIPVDYRLLKSVSNCSGELIIINSNSAITEEERKVQCSEKITFFLEALSNNTALTTALSVPLSNPADIALKIVLKNYLGNANREILRSLPASEMVSMLEALHKSLYDYIIVVLKKAPLIFERLKFNPTEILWLKEHKGVLGTDLLWDKAVIFENEDFFKTFSKLYYLSVLAKIRSAISSLSWIDLLEITVVNGENAKANWFQAFISLYTVGETSLEFLCGSKDEVNNKGRLNFSFPEDYINAENLLAILNCCRVIEKLGGNDALLRALLSTNVLTEETSLVESLLKSRYGSKEWLDVIKPINDRLRTRRRDALMAWLLANTNGGAWHSANDMYEWLLIDTEMDACMVTSRIKQGISSIQLFIDRCLMNLEKGITLSKDFIDQWHSWRKQYRVWEANRKIFLYPENWIEPELRDDKSPFFKELESQLKQNEVTEETAKEALITYLHKLDTVANLEIVGMFHENEEERNIVHVFGRKQSIPHQYFYRKQEHSIWTAWEKVEVDIEGDHILPVVWNGRLMLFWAQLTEKQVEGSSTTSLTGDSGDMTMTSTKPKKYSEMKLAWAEYKNKKWSSKKVSKEVWSSQEIWHPSVDFDNKYISLDSEISDNKLGILLFVSDPLSENEIIRSGIIFEFDSCNSYPKRKAHPYSGMEKYTPNNTILNKMKIESVETNHPFTIFENGFYNFKQFPTPPIVFNNIGQFEVLASHNKRLDQKPLLFFYNNNKDTFYVVSNEKVRPVSDTDVVTDSTSLLARKIVENPGRTIDTRASSEREHINTLTPVLVNSELGTASGIVGIDWVFQGKKYLFQTFYHPFVCAYIKILNSIGIDALYQKDIQNKEPKIIFTTTEYDPTELVLAPYPKQEVDFSYTGSYSIFNWELFYHIPLLIATRLTQNQKFEEARKWFHYIFDPTRSSDIEPGAKRFWITKPFRKEIEDDVLSLEDLLNREENSNELDIQLTNWEHNPFNPHAVARLRISAYMRNTVLKYIDNLILWGDQLFRRDTIESINEATLLYILASNILGKRMETVPPRAEPIDQSFSDMKEKLDRFSNVKAEIESFISASSGDDNILMPYFCLPKNDHLLKYWDTVADRLFKIRHCMNIEGIVRQLPLFEPPLDPGLLMRAKDAGLDLNTILDDVNIKLPNYRFQVVFQKANELCNDVKLLGSSLLSVLEKKDVEELALLRSTHELKMLEVIKEIREKRRDEANENLNSLQASRVVIEERQNYYSGRDFMNVGESMLIASTFLGMGLQIVQSQQELLASILYNTPDFKIGSGFTFGATAGGTTTGNSAKAMATVYGALAIVNNTAGILSGTIGGYQRRMDDWKFQAKSAELELKQIDKQILATEIRLAIAEKELENHDLQIEHSKEEDDYMRSKFTNAELYDYMVGQLSTVYFQSYQLAYITAKKAEKCLQHELGLEGTNYVQFGYWDSLKKGLLSGEKLQYNLRRLENAYLEQNNREYEIVKHISISMLDPLALIKLRSTGITDFDIPEVLYDMDHAGHYFRRLKSVSVSLPCIAGPYTSVSAKLTLGGNKYRKSQDGAYEEAETDSRFIYNIGSIESIATSNAQNDSGVFELNFRDERYLPFEGTGAISSWKLELPSVIRQFDYNTISDVIIHMKYTARDGGDDLKKLVNDSLTDTLNKITQRLNEQGLHIAINMKYDLSNEWHQLKANGQVNLKIDKSSLPYIAQSLVSGIESVMFVARIRVNLDNFEIKVKEVTTGLNKIIHDGNDWGLYKTDNIVGISLGEFFSLSIAAEQLNDLEDLMILVKYGL